MNFFRKGNTAFISLTPQDLGGDPGELWDRLKYVFEGYSPETARLRLQDCNDIGLKPFSLIAGLALNLKGRGTGLELEGSKQLIAIVRKLNFTAYFKSLTEVS